MIALYGRCYLFKMSEIRQVVTSYPSINQVFIILLKYSGKLCDILAQKVTDLIFFFQFAQKGITLY